MADRIQIAEARKGFAAVVARSAAGVRIKLTRYGRTLAGLVPKRDIQTLEDQDKREARGAASTAKEG
jgi:antitoxin (DNA-binding transcriptional repressor) of toxin-antitoxin stability system